MNLRTNSVRFLDLDPCFDGKSRLTLLYGNQLIDCMVGDKNWNKIEQAMRTDQPVVGVLPLKRTVVDISTINTMEYHPFVPGIVLQCPGYGDSKGMTIGGGLTLPEATKLADAVGFGGQPEQRMASFGEVSFTPGVITLMAALFGLILLVWAASVDPNPPVPGGFGNPKPKPPGLDFSFDSTGSIILLIFAIALPLASIGWWGYCVLNRSNVTKFQRA